MKYVGLQDENTGPSAAPMTMSPHMPPRWFPAASSLLPPIFKDAGTTASQSPGKNMKRPTMTSMPPETICQNSAGTLTNAVETFSASVNMNTDAASESVMAIARRGFAAPLTLPPMTTGKSGSMHGASTVSAPATNEIKSNVIPPSYLAYAGCKGSYTQPFIRIYLAARCTRRDGGRSNRCASAPPAAGYRRDCFH